MLVRFVGHGRHGREKEDRIRSGVWQMAGKLVGASGNPRICHAQGVIRCKLGRKVSRGSEVHLVRPFASGGSLR